MGAAQRHDGTDASKKAADMNGRKTMLLLLSEGSPIKAHLLAGSADVLKGLSQADVKPVHDMEPNVPMQFIYSRDDNIISSEGIEEYIAEVVARPNRKGHEKPQTLVFDKSPHVKHKMQHKDAYAKCVESFASSVLVGA